MPLRGETSLRRETEAGALPFRPPPRTRSEASFSEFRYDNTSHPPAGVDSARLLHHHSKDCSQDTAHISQAQAVMRMTPEQEFNCQFDCLDGPRMDPARCGAAGNLSRNTKIKVTLLAQHGQGNDCKQTPPGVKHRPIPGYILDVARKSPASCKPPRSCNDPLKPVEEQFNRSAKRFGYPNAAATWTWAECNEVGGSPHIVNMHDPNVVLKGLSPCKIKMHRSAKGEKRYNVCGVEDMLPAGQEKFVKGDAPPSARHLYENDKNHLAGFERGVPPKCGGGPEFLAQSPGMWNCMSGQDRPLDTYRSMNASASEPEFSWMDAAESYYGNESVGVRQAFNSQQGSACNSQQGTPRYDTTMPRDGRRSLQSSPCLSEFSQQQYRPERTKTGNRRSLLSSPTASEFSAVRSRASRRSSRASATSSQLELATRPRWN